MDYGLKTAAPDADYVPLDGAAMAETVAAWQGANHHLSSRRVAGTRGNGSAHDSNQLGRLGTPGVNKRKRESVASRPLCSRLLSRRS